MSKTVDELYLDIARRVVETINEEWEESTIYFQYFGDSGEYSGRYITKEKYEKGFKVGFKTYKDFKEIHTIMTSNDSNKWNKAKFTLYPSGKFNIDFEWDQSLADEIEANS